MNRNDGASLRLALLFSLIMSWALLVPGPVAATGLRETPMLAPQVAAGTLPPVEARVPRVPDMAEDIGSVGRPGGELRMLMASPKDTRIMVVYGYARLVAYTPSLEIVPDILERLDVEDGRVFTLHLRPGHKWSDGHPFTSEDFRYWFEDVASKKELSMAGLPVVLMPHGEPPRFEVLDRETVRYTWARPNPLFLPALAGASPLYIYAPAHYLKQFHKKYADKEKLAALVKEAGARNWAALHNKKEDMYKNDNPDEPTLEPWVLKTRPPSDRLVFERNPYYYRIDSTGQQLPYIDRVVFSIANSKIIPAKTGAGESDLQARYLSFDDYTFLKAGEDQNGYKVLLWRTGPGSQLALYPNLNVDDATWRELVRDVRFRRALSLATNRHEINQAIYFGLAIEGQNTILPQSPLYRPEYRQAWAQFDIAEANRLLDEIGLARGADGLRHLPDGRPLDIVVEDSGESTRQRRRHRIDPRCLAAGRRPAVHAPDAADPVPPPRVLRADADVDLQGRRERPADGRYVAGGIRADNAATAPMAEMGPIFRDQGPGRRAARPALGGAAPRPLRSLAACGGCRRARPNLARDAAPLGRRGLFDRHHRRGAAAGCGQHAPAQRAG